MQNYKNYFWHLFGKSIKITTSNNDAVVVSHPVLVYIATSLVLKLQDQNLM